VDNTSQHSRSLIEFHENATQNFKTLKSMIESIVPILKKVIEAERERQISTNIGCNPATELNKVMLEVKETNMKIYDMIVNTQQSLPAQVELQQPVHFIDACGKHAPFHLEFINSWEVFESVLKHRFRDIGLQKINRREYVLERSGNKKLVTRKTPWERCLLPGTTLTMDMLFQTSYNQANSCPVCGLESEEAIDAEIDW
jgi:hypothetical protein